MSSNAEMGPRHTLTEEERAWATDLKERLEKDFPEALEGVTDFDICVHAILSKGWKGNGKARVVKMHQMRKKYSLNYEHDFETFIRVVKTTNHLCYPATHPDGRPILPVVMRYKSANKILALDKAKDQYAQANIEMAAALTTDLEVARKGVVTLVDISQMGWANSSRILHAVDSELFSNCMPVNMNGAILVNAPFYARAFLRPLAWMSSWIRNTVRVATKEELCDEFGEDAMTPEFGGRCSKTLEDWVNEARRRRQESIDAVHL